MPSCDETSIQLRKEQDEFSALQILGIPSCRAPGRSPDVYLPLSSASPALSHPGTHWAHSALGCAPADPPAVQDTGRPQPRPGPPPAKWEQLLAVQFELGSTVPRTAKWRPGVNVQVRVSGYRCSGSLGSACVPSEPRGAHTSGVHVLVFGNTFHQHHWTGWTSEDTGEQQTNFSLLLSKALLRFWGRCGQTVPMFNLVTDLCKSDLFSVSNVHFLISVVFQLFHHLFFLLQLSLVVIETKPA